MDEHELHDRLKRLEESLERFRGNYEEILSRVHTIETNGEISKILRNTAKEEMIHLRNDMASIKESLGRFSWLLISTLATIIVGVLMLWSGVLIPS